MSFEENWKKIGGLDKMFGDFGDVKFDQRLFAHVRWRTAEALAFKAAHTPGLTDEQRQTLSDMANHEVNCAVALLERVEHRRY